MESVPLLSLEQFLQDKVGIENAAEIPTLDIGDRKGWTGYIDFIKVEDVSAPLMAGYDCHGRLFLAIRYTDVDGTRKVLTVFQRYVGNHSTFCNGTSYTEPVLFSDRYMKDSYWPRLRELITTGRTGTDDKVFILE